MASDELRHEIADLESRLAAAKTRLAVNSQPQKPIQTNGTYSQRLSPIANYYRPPLRIPTPLPPPAIRFCPPPRLLRLQFRPRIPPRPHWYQSVHLQPLHHLPPALPFFLRKQYSPLRSALPPHAPESTGIRRPSRCIHNLHCCPSSKCCSGTSFAQHMGSKLHILCSCDC